jgi:CRP/FNR family transcriptional regulator, anaerobic regulatory protein
MSPSNNPRLRPVRGADHEAADRASAGGNGVHLMLRRRQRIALQYDAPDHAFVVESGCLTLDAVLPQNRRQVTLILYAGDVILRSAAPPVPQIGLTAMLPSVVDRRRTSDPGVGANAANAKPLDLAAAIARVAARTGLHAIAIGRLTGEERIATLLLEMALYLGKPTLGGQTFEIPLSRNDMADYMALNPDTLSRLMSRLRASGLVTMPTRSRATIKDLAALEAMTPLADALRQLRSATAPTVTVPEAVPALPGAV